MKSVALRAADYRAVFRLIGECQELGDDVNVWLQHLYGGLGRLVGADLVMGGEMGGVPYGPLRTVGIAEWGWEQGFNRTGWVEALRWFDRDPLRQPILRALMENLKRQPSLTTSRQRLLTDRDWYSSEAFDVIHMTVGVDPIMHSFLPIEPDRDVYSGIVINRARGRRNFNEREQRLVAFAHADLTPQIGRSLARFDEPRPSDLAPRVRAVLRCLLEGDGDKQIAVRLNLSGHTVNQYLKTLYRHFGVCSRAELLACWIRRGWTSNCSWIDQADRSPGGGTN
jgi:DNA-binding CsgD family transcriptional regulator